MRKWELGVMGSRDMDITSGEGGRRESPLSMWKKECECERKMVCKSRTKMKNFFAIISLSSSFSTSSSSFLLYAFHIIKNTHNAFKHMGMFAALLVNLDLST